MTRKRSRSKTKEEVQPADAAQNDNDPENPDPAGRFREMFWFPLRDQAARHILEAADGSPATLVNSLHKAAGQGNPGERFSTIVRCLADLLASHDQSVQRTAARLLGHAFSPLRGTIMEDGLALPEELEQALPAILGASAILDSEFRLSLLAVLEHLPSRRCAPSILPPITEYLFKDDASEVVIQALDVVMATGVDLASVAIPAIVGLLGHHDQRVRLSACEALAKFGTEVGQATSKVFTDQASREAILSLLRAIGPQARDLRVQLTGLWDTTKASLAKGTSDPEAAHSPDFRSVHWFGTEYTFTVSQAACVDSLGELAKQDAGSQRSDHSR